MFRRPGFRKRRPLVECWRKRRLISLRSNSFLPRRLPRSWRRLKRLPRSLRPQKTRPTRTKPTERKSIVRLDKPEHERGRSQERLGTVISDKMNNNEELRRWLEGLGDEDLGRYKM